MADPNMSLTPLQNLPEGNLGDVEMQVHLYLRSIPVVKQDGDWDIAEGNWWLDVRIVSQNKLYILYLINYSNRIQCSGS